MIKKGMVFSPQYGDTAFTVPLFDQYMKRVMPKMPRVPKKKAAAAAAGAVVAK